MERALVEEEQRRQKDALMQGWLREFVGDQLRYEVLHMRCPTLLSYWEWFFSYYPLRPDFTPTRRHIPRLDKFGWYECLFYLDDRIFIEAIHMWWQRNR